MIDNRLLDCNGEPEITENFNRVLNLIGAGGGGNTDLTLVDLTTSTETNFTILPNKVYLLGDRNTFTVTFDTPEDETVENIYTVKWTCDATTTPSFVFMESGNETALTNKGVNSYADDTKYEASFAWSDKQLIIQ